MFKVSGGAGLLRKSPALPLQPQVGDVLIFDSRTVHRGLRNTHKRRSRPLLYLVYARPWWVDTVNFAPAGNLFGALPQAGETSDDETRSQKRAKHAGEALAHAADANSAQFHSSCKVLWQAVGHHILS